MGLTVSQKQYTPAPEGMHAAVCVDVVDLGMVEGQFGPKHKCRVAWEIAPTMEDGRRFTIQKSYTVSLHEKSNLFKDLKAWRGRAFTAQELAGFDLEKVLGAPCQLVVTHADSEGKTYANVTAILKADPKNVLKPSGNYVRVKDREGYVPPQAATVGHDEEADAAANRGPAEDDAPPF